MTTPTPALPADHGARDLAVAVNSYTTVAARRSVPEELFRAYWRDVHGPLCSRVPALGFYVQHHFARRRDAHLWPLPAGVGPLPGYELDGAVEIGWASEQAQAEFQDASGILFSDEQNVFEETAAFTALTDRLGELVTAVTAFPVSGVFTFVRDGELTTAGLRGSRVAELVRDLAATNQVADDVRHLMRTGLPR